MTKRLQRGRTIPFLRPRVVEDLKANWQTAKPSSLADIASTKTDNVIGFPLKFEHGALVSSKKCRPTMQRKSIIVITASERRSLNGDAHLYNCHNDNVAFAI